MAYSFGSQGALPSLNAVPGANFNVMPQSTPAGRALNYAQIGTPAPKTPPTVLPTTPVKKTTVNNVDGSSHTTEYHAPETPQTQPSSVKQSDGSSTLSAPGYGGANGTPSNAPTGGYISPYSSTPIYNSDGSVNQGALSSAQLGMITPGQQSAPNQSGIINSAVSSAQANAGIGQNAAQIAADFGKRIADTGVQGARAQAGYLTTGTSPVGEGNAAVVNQSTAAQEQALASGESAALAGTSQQLAAQGQETSGLVSAGGLNTPSNKIMQVSPGNYVVDSQGNAVGGGQAAGVKAATDWAIAQQNMEQGRDYQGQAQAISNALQTLAPVKQAIVPYMSANNLDSNGVPFVNQQINKINKQANPAAFATMEAAISEARSYAIQLLGSQSGANPTDVTNSVNSFDFDNFTPGQLGTFLNNLDALGQYRLSQAQSASQAGYGANGQVGTPAQGVTATPGKSLESGGANLLNSLPDPVKLIVGGAISIGPGALKSLGEVATGGASGAAAATEAPDAMAATVLGI